MGSKRSGSEMFGSRILGTGWVEGSERSGRKFEQNKVSGNNILIMEQVRHNKTREQVGEST